MKKVPRNIREEIIWKVNELEVGDKEPYGEFIDRVINMAINYSYAAGYIAAENKLNNELKAAKAQISIFKIQKNPKEMKKLKRWLKKQ